MMRCGVWTAGLCVAAGVAMAGQGEPARWAVIGDPGNRDIAGDELEFPPHPLWGSVGYVFGMSRLETTLGEYAEFAEAYLPFFYDQFGDDPQQLFQFEGHSLEITRDGVSLGWHSPDQAATMSWEYAARYVNWLHHGKVNEAWAFETGVYDVSTFGCAGSDGCKLQWMRSPGARYWIPNINEWTKAAFWDPEKNNGEGGYWRYPNGTDHALRPGFPGEGGQRNARPSHNVSGFPLDVGSFPDQPSPWGLLDLAGGESEWIETECTHCMQHWRAYCGSDWGWSFYNEPYDVNELDPDRRAYPIAMGAVFSEGLRVARTAMDPADLNGDGGVSFYDVSTFIRWFIDGDERADLRLDGVFDLDDVRVFLGLMGEPISPCP